MPKTRPVTAQRVKVTISLPPDWAEAFRAYADAEGVTMSEWLRDCGYANLRAADQKRLDPAPPRGRPKLTRTIGSDANGC